MLTDNRIDPQPEFREFINGPIYWSPATGAHPVVNSFLFRWGQNNYEAGRLKYPTTDEIVLPDGGRRQEFQQGAIYVAFQNAVGAAIFNGPLRDKYNSVGGLTPGSSFLGYPTQDQAPLPDGQGQMDRFQNGVIYWHPTHGAHPVSGITLAEWSAAGYEGGEYGYPTSDEYLAPPGHVQDFQHKKFDYGLVGTPVSGDAYDCDLNVSWPAMSPTTNWVQSNVTATCTDPKQRIDARVRVFWTAAGSSNEVRKSDDNISNASTSNPNSYRTLAGTKSIPCFNGTYRLRVDYDITNADGGHIYGRQNTNSQTASACQTGTQSCPGIPQNDCTQAVRTVLYAQFFNGATRPGLDGGSVFQNNLGHIPSPVGQWREYDLYPRNNQSGQGTPPQRVVIDDGRPRDFEPVWFTEDHYKTQEGWTEITFVP